MNYMHPMVLLQTEISIQEQNIADSKVYLVDFTTRLEKMFKDSILYKELMEKYIKVDLYYIDEDETIIKVFTSMHNYETLTFISSEIENKLLPKDQNETINNI